MTIITERHWVTKKGKPCKAHVVDFVDQSGKRAKKQFKLKRDAQDYLVEIASQIKTGTYSADAEKMTIGDVCDKYITRLKGEVDRNEVTDHYYRTTKAQLYNYVSPRADHREKQHERNRVDFDGGIGNVKLSQCTRPVVIRLRDELREANVGVVTTRRILGSLSRALSYARDEGWLRAANPAANVSVKAARTERGKQKKNKVVMPTKEEFKLARDLATGSLGMRIRLAAMTGLRASEMYALLWGDISFNAGEMSVTRRADAQGKIDVTKSDASTRIIPLSAAILEELRQWRDQAKAKEAGDLIFPNARGKHIDHRNMLLREFKPLLENAATKAKENKIKFKPFRWHSLRHFAISTWIEAGFQPKEVQTMAGHSTLAVTMDVYGDIFPKESRRDFMDSIAEELA